MRHRRGLLLTAVTLPAMLAMTATFPAAGSATLVKAVPIVVKTEQDAAGSRSFELTYRPRASAAVSDRGFAARVYEQRSDRAVRNATDRRVAGTERLESERGTLTLRWNGVQRMRNGRWGKAMESGSSSAGPVSTLVARGEATSSPTTPASSTGDG
jgi:hypothetical protein